MISFSKIMRQVLNETMSFRDLWKASDPARKKRSDHVKPKQMFSRSVDAEDSWIFSYKSDPGWSTTGKRWHGYVALLKNGVVDNHNVEVLDVDCKVDCDCPDYRYRWAYNNAKQGAGDTGPKSWNLNNGQPPRPREQGGVGDLGPGLCKHLMSLVAYLGSEIDSVAPEPDDKPKEPLDIDQKKLKVKKVRPADTKPSSIAPDPTDSYTDSREDSDGSSYSDLRESSDLLKFYNRMKKTPRYTIPENDVPIKIPLSQRISNFVKNNPEFTVPYE